MSLEGGRRPSRARKSVTHYSDDNPSTFTIKRKRSDLDGAAAPPSLGEMRSRRRDKRSRHALRRQSSSNLSASSNTGGANTIPSSIRLKSSGRRHYPDNSSHQHHHGSPKRKRPRHASTAHPNDEPSVPEATDEILAHRVMIQPVLRPKSAPVMSRKVHRTPLQQLAAHGRWNGPRTKPHTWKPLPPAFTNHRLLGAAGETINLPPAGLTAVARHDATSPYWLAGDAAGRVVVWDVRWGRCVRTLETVASQREATRVMTSKTVVSFPNLVHALSGQGETVVVWTAHELQALCIPTGETLWKVPLQVRHAQANASQITAAAAALQCLDMHGTQAKLLWQKPKTLQPTEKIKTESNVTLFLLDWTSGELTCQSIQPEEGDSSHAVVWDEHDAQALLQVATNAQEGWELRRIHASSNRVMDRTVLHNHPNGAGGGGVGGGSASHPYTGCRIKQAADYLFLCTNRGIRCLDAQRLTFLTVYGETVALHGKTVGWQDCFWLPEPVWPHTIWQDHGKTGNTGNLNTLSSGSGGGGGGGGGSHNTCLLSTQDELARRRAVARHPRSSSSRSTVLGTEKTTGTILPKYASTTTTSSPNTTTTTSSPHGAKNLFSNMLLVGIPHPHRGPSELQSTLYVWKPGQVLPLTTLQAPVGGLLGLYARADPVNGWHLTCATAAHGQAWEFRHGLQSDFSGNMYPTHYQVIDDNVEYLEDEDELDKGSVNGGGVGRNSDDASSVVALTQDEEDLQRALRESLDDEGNVKIDVLNSDDDDDENAVPNPFCTCVPAWPDPSLRPQSLSFGKNGSSQQSPSRFRETKAEPELFAGFPQLAAVRQARHVARETSSTPPPPTAAPMTEAERVAILTKATKGKRSRTANVEVLLQASIDPTLRQEMLTIHKKWSDGKASRLRPPTTLRRTAEEKELALELLLLSPGGANDKSENGVKQETTHVALVHPPSSNGSQRQHGMTKPASITKTLKEPPEPPRIVSTATTECSRTSRVQKNGMATATAAVCPACWGRMVIHTCGKRAKPVDMEALERAEAERKAAEDAEKQRIKVEKRRAAEAKRREARKKKKEEEERKRREEELQRLEEERVAAMQKAEPTSTYSYTSSVETTRKIPRYADLMSAPVEKRENEYSFGYAAASTSTTTVATNLNGTSNRAKESYARQPSSNVSEESTYSSNSFTPAAVEPLFKPEETTPLEQTTYRSGFPSYTSASISVTTSVSKPLTASDSDALAVLAGLADQSAKAPYNASVSAAETDHFDYRGAEDRRRAILNQYRSLHTPSSATEDQSFSVYDRPANYDAYRYTSATTTDSETLPSNGSGLLYFNHKPKADDSRS